MQTESNVTMSDLERRLQELRQELSTGETQLAALDKKRRETGETMLRIAGAIQVLEELLQAPAQHAAVSAATSADAPIAANGLQAASIKA
jgi:chromosome segregation ATPase